MSSLTFDQHFAFLKWPAGQAWRHTKWHGHERAQAKLFETKCFTGLAGWHVKTSPQTGTLINNYQCAGLRESFEIAVFSTCKSTWLPKFVLSSPCVHTSAAQPHPRGKSAPNTTSTSAWLAKRPNKKTSAPAGAKTSLKKLARSGDKIMSTQTCNIRRSAGDDTMTSYNEPRTRRGRPKQPTPHSRIHMLVGVLNKQLQHRTPYLHNPTSLSNARRNQEM